MGLRPWEYDRLQPFEVLDLEEAAKWKRDREWERQALVAATLTMPNTEKGTLFADVYQDVLHSLPGYEPEK
jgi:hypothetical protein